MPDEHRITLRLTPELYAQLQARGSHGQPLAAILREALVDYLARQPRQPAPAAPADTTPLPPAATAALADTTALDYDPTRFALGLLCPRKHEYRGTGQTLRRLPSHVCPACDVEQQRERRQAQREGRG